MAEDRDAQHQRLTEEHAVVLYRLTAAENRITKLEEQVANGLAEMNEAIQKLVVQTALLDFRAGIWGALAGAVPSLIVALLMYLRGVFH